MRDQEILGLHEAYNQVYEEVDTRRVPKEMIDRLNASREGHMAQDGPNKPAYDAKQRLLKKAHKKRTQVSEAKDETEIGITGLPIPKKKRSPAKQHEFEKKRRKNIGTNVGGEKYKKDVNPHLNPRSVREEVLSYLLDEGFASDEKSAEAIMGAMSEAWVESIVEEILDEEKKEFPSDKVNKKAAKHERDYLKRPNSYVGQSSKLKSKKMRAIKSTVDAGGDPRNTMHGQDLRKIKTRPSMD